MEAQRTVAIIGAGLTGPTAALALARAGYGVTVFDQRPASALYSTGILGMRHGNCRNLEAMGVDLSSRLPGHIYRDYTNIPRKTRTPFNLFAWTDLHNAITRAAIDAGAVFHYETPVETGWHPRTHMADVTIDAGGLTSAARHLRGTYIDQIIFRGISPVHTRDAFSTIKIPARHLFCDIGNTRAGTAFAFGVERPMPESLATTWTHDVPPETDFLPVGFQRIIRATNPIQVLPQSVWTPPGTIHNATWTHLSLGDANGPVRPLTTSGANLACQAGMAAPELLNRNEMLASQILAERAYALRLGVPGTLYGPQIGGYLEDPHFYAHQHGLYAEATL